ncbi:serine/threonine-protein phosphatase 6 regulatory ankyrin repeat subunit B-like isoform X2 [Mytilus edulis]
MPTDLEKRISEMEYSPHTGPPAEIDDNKKRWLVVGICLHSVLSPALRKYVEPVVTSFYNSLKLSHQIEKQSFIGHLKIYGAVDIKYLNYKAINNNKNTFGNRTLNYDYKIQNAVDLSKLFLEINMVHYKGFDESCDASALLGIIINIDKFPANVQSAAEYVRSNIRNRWAHCNFTEWNSGMYYKSLQEVEDFINLLHLNATEKSQTIGELNKWKTNGTSYLKDTTLGLELVNDIRQQIQLLVEYEKVICKSADAEFSKVHNELTEIGKTLSQFDNRISSLENKVALQETTLLKYKSLYDAEPVINAWKQKMELFVETNVVIDILEILKDSHCALLIGVSGMGKTLTAQNVALRLWHEKEYNIVPCCSLNDIQTRYRDNVNQVFFIDDICGRYTTNILKIENWMNIEEFVKCILLKGKTKILATCRTEVFFEEIFQDTFEMFSKTTYNLSEKYSFKDKLVIAEKYLKQDEETLSATLRKVEFTPLMCFLYAQHEHFDINDFLNGPYETFCKEWDKLKSFDKEKYCVLFLCVLYNGRIDESFVDFSIELDKNEKRKLKDIKECCNLGRDTSRVAIKDKLNACIDTYVMKVDKEYKVVHDKMFDFLCCYFGKKLIAQIIKYAHDMVIFERVQLESLQEAHGYFTIMVSEKDEHIYNDRIKADLENGKIHCCLNNAQMKYKEYRIKFRDIIKDLEINLIRNLINIKDDNGINSFIIACLRGYDELVDFLISVGADVDGRVGFFTPLTAACHGGHLNTVEILLKGGSNIDDANTQGETPLYTACVGGYYNLVNLLIEKEADINKQNKFSRTPLHASCMLGHATIVSILIDKGANVFQYKDLLIAATLAGNDKIVEILLLKGCCLNSVDIEGKTALVIACEEGNTYIVKLLIDDNADIYIVDSDGRTPLHAACCVGNNDIVRMLVNKNADVNMLDVHLETPLHISCRKGFVDVILTLLDNRADTKKTNKDMQTPLHLAKTDGNIVNESILKLLRYKETGPNEGLKTTESTQDKLQKKDTACTDHIIANGGTPLYEACVHGDIETFKSLIRYKVDVNMPTTSGDMPLVAACQHGHGFLIQTLLDERADVNQALVCAIQKGYDRAIKILLYKVRDFDYKVNGKSFISLACEHGSINAIKTLSEKDVDFKEIDVNGRTLIHIACNTDSVDVIQLLEDNGSDLNIPDKDGRFPLFLSIYNDCYNVSEFLIQKGCHIAKLEEDTKIALISVFEDGRIELSKLLVSNDYTEKLSNFDETMLYHACRLGLFEKVKTILQNGIDVNKTYKYGYTPMILADIGGNDDLSEYLQNHTCFDSLTGSTTFFHESRINRYITETRTSRYCIDRKHLYTSEYGLDLCKELYQSCINGEQTFRITNQILKRGMQVNFFFHPSEPYVSIWFKQTALCLACRRGNEKIVNKLLELGANVDMTAEESENQDDDCLSLTIRYGYTPLFAACQRKKYKIVDMLLQRKANINKALYDASREGYLDIVKFLLQKGADVNSFGRHGQTALYAACIGGYFAIVKFLIKQGAAVNLAIKRDVYSSYEKTSLNVACRCGNHKIVQFLIDRGASLDTMSNIGRTLLHTACKQGHYKIVKILIGKGVSLNAIDQYGYTPLMFIVQEEEDYITERQYMYDFYRSHGTKIYEPPHFLTDNHYRVIEQLIENGADVNKVDKKGRTPLSLAKKIGNNKLKNMMLA